MKKMTWVTLLVMGSLVSSSLGGVVALADRSINYTVRNVLENAGDESVTITDLNGREAFLSGGPHGGTGAKSVFTDGVISSTQTAMLTDSDGNGIIGYVTIDAGKEYVVNKVLVDIVHDWGAEDFSIELSRTADFADPVVVYSNRSGAGFTADAFVSVSDVLYNLPYVGETFGFSPVRARYIRVTGNTVGNGAAQGYTCLGEIQMYAIEGGAPVYADVVSGVYDGTKRVSLGCDADGAEIYYTTDGSVPTKASLKYEAPLELSGRVRLRAVSYAEGKYGAPFDFDYTFGSASSAFQSENACFGKSVIAYDVQGNELAVSDHNGGQTLEAVVDGRTDAFNSIQLASVGFIQVDMGESVWINKAVLNLWHDNVFRSMTVQLSDDPTFATGVQTIFCSDVGNWNGLSAYVGSMDPSQNYNQEWVGNNGTGFTYEFEPIKGRYIRALAQLGSSAPYNSIYTELQAWTCEEPKQAFQSENACFGKSVIAYDVQGNELAVSDHNGGQTLEAVVDGRTDAFNSIQLASVGFIQVDMGESVWINKAVLNLWHDNVFRSMTVQLSDDPTFATGVQTIFCSDVGNWNGLSAYVGSMDPSQNYNQEWVGNNGTGFTYEFEPIRGRYIRALAQLGSSAPYNSIYTELQAWTCEEPSADYEYKHYLSSVSVTESVEVYCNKDFSGLGLPSALTVRYSDGTEKQLACTWSDGGYDKTTAGEYFATASLSDENDYYGLLENISVKITVKALDTAALDQLLSDADGIEENDYTLSTVDALRAARLAAGSVREREYKTQAEIDGAYNELFAAYDALRARGDATALKALYDSVKEYASGDYTAATFTSFAEALSAVKEAADEEYGDLDQAQADRLLSALSVAKDGLIRRAGESDYAALKAAEENLRKEIADESKITTSSLLRARFLLEEAGACLGASDETKANVASADVNALIKRLLDEKPELRGSAQALKAYFDECKLGYGYSEADTRGYLIRSYVAYLDRMYEVEALLEDEVALSDMTQADIDGFYASLEAAVEALAPCADRTQFDAAVERARALEEGQYTADSFGVLAEALSEALVVYETPSGHLTQSDVEGPLANLTAALEQLERKGDKSELNEYIALYSSEEAKDYTAASFAPFVEALYEANKARRSDVGQAAVDAAALGLKEAYEALVRLGDRTGLQALVDAAREKDVTGAEKKRVEELEAAIGYAQAMLDFDGEVTEAQTAEAAELLESAMRNLDGVAPGCGGVIGLSGAFVAAGMAAAAILKKKRCENEEI